jgi:hypothetical protein
LEIDPQEFSFESVDSIRAPEFLPGGARFMDLPGLLASLNNVSINMLGDLPNDNSLDRLHRMHNNQLQSQ